jgi:hypothetical protein
MAVTSNLTSLETFESSPTYNNIGSGGGATDNTDVFIEGSQSGGRRVDNATDKGFMATISSTDLSAADVHVKIWVFCFHWSAVTGFTARIASGTTAYDNHEYGTTDIPILGGWIPMWLDVSRSPDSTGTSGCNEAAVTDIGAYIDIANVGGAGDNFIIDEIMHGTGGYTWTGSSGSFADFRTYESSNNEGVFLSLYGADLCYARLQIGSGSTLTTFTDSGFTITFPDQPLVSSTFMGLSLHAGNFSTNINLSDGAIVSGDPTGGTNKFEITVTGTLGKIYFDTLLINGARTIVLTSNVIMTDCVILNTGVVESPNTSCNGTTIASSTVGADVGALKIDVTTVQSGRYNDMTFVKGTNAHHAIDYGTSMTNDVTLTRCEFTGFGSTDDSNDSTVRFLATSGSLTLTLTDCTVDGAAATSSNFSIDDAAGVAVTLSIDPVTQLVNVKDVNGTNIQNARVFIETAATITNGEIFEAAVSSLSGSFGTATCNTTAAHGLTTGDKVVIRGAQPDGYNKVATVTVSDSDTFTYTCDFALSGIATGTIVVSFVALHDLTDSSGNASASRTWGAAQQLKGWARKKNSSSPFYKDADISYSVDTSNGNTTNLILQPDE